jgi:phosphatidylglycerophosphate synthase
VFILARYNRRHPAAPGGRLLSSSAGSFRWPLVVAVTLVLTGGKPPKPDSSPAAWLVIAKIVIGLALLGLAVMRYSRRNQPSSPPAWRSKLEHMTFLAAASFGFLFQPWPLVAAGALTVASADLSQLSAVIAVVGFILLASSSLLVIEGYAALSPAAARLRLSRFQSFLETHTDMIITVLAAAVGTWLAGYSLFLLVM